MTGEATLADLETRLPEIRWREPSPLTIAADPPWEGLACRVCIAQHGLSAQAVLSGEAPHAFKTREEFDEHFEQHLEGARA